jgi:hypothetical protein
MPRDEDTSEGRDIERPSVEVRPGPWAVTLGEATPSMLGCLTRQLAFLGGTWFPTLCVGGLFSLYCFAQEPQAWPALPVVVAALALVAVPAVDVLLGADEAELSVRMARSVWLVPGVFVAAGCALFVPLQPFRGPLTSILMTLPLPLIAWVVGASLAHWHARTGLLPRWRPFLRRTAWVTAALIAFAGVRGIHRPSPDLYWDSLVPAHAEASSDFRWVRAPYGNGLVEQRRDHNPCEAFTTRPGTCNVIIDEERCARIPHSGSEFGQETSCPCPQRPSEVPFVCPWRG